VRWGGNEDGQHMCVGELMWSSTRICGVRPMIMGVWYASVHCGVYIYRV
jgi:hypothetical protein